MTTQKLGNFAVKYHNINGKREFAFSYGVKLVNGKLPQ